MNNDDDIIVKLKGNVIFIGSFDEMIVNFNDYDNSLEFENLDEFLINKFKQISYSVLAQLKYKYYDVLEYNNILDEYYNLENSKTSPIIINLAKYNNQSIKVTCDNIKLNMKEFYKYKNEILILNTEILGVCIGKSYREKVSIFNKLNSRIMSYDNSQNNNHIYLK